MHDPIVKMPTEKIPKTVDYTGRLPTGDSMTGATGAVVVYDRDGSDVTSNLLSSGTATIDEAEETATFVCKDTASSYIGSYDVFLTLTTEQAYKLTDYFHLIVQERA